MANPSTDTALFADDATEPSYRNTNYVAYATTAYKVSVTIDATPPCSTTVYWWCFRADAITSGKSHSIQSDIAGYYSWISTKIVSRVSIAYIVFSCWGSEPVDRLLPLLHGAILCTSCHGQSSGRAKSNTDVVLQTDDATEAFKSMLDNECCQCRQGL